MFGNNLINASSADVRCYDTLSFSKSIQSDMYPCIYTRFLNIVGKEPYLLACLHNKDSERQCGANAEHLLLLKLNYILKWIYGSRCYSVRSESKGQSCIFSFITGQI